MKKSRLTTRHLRFGIIACIALIAISGFVAHKAQAATEETEADLRFIFTTDIHGQLNSIDYETGTSYNGGLAKAYSLVKEAREESPNSMTFDVGDVIYDYTTEYFYSTYQAMLQPIYQAMGQVGYDAVTLGNHEFDYDFDYVKNQLKSAGLTDKVVVSNLTDSKNNSHIFHENMIITKTLVTNNKQTMEVKIGIIGETLPVLSSKSQNFTGVLKVQDIVENVQEEAAKLKAQGADIIVVLNHSGVGTEKPEYGEKNVSYALTKLDDVDVVLCGHEHNQFPSEDKTIAYYKLPGVDKGTELVNGKNMVMAQDRGRSIGVVDLTLAKEDGEIVIKERYSDVRKVTKDTPEDKHIASMYDDYKEELLAYSKSIIGEVPKGDSITNYTGLLEDNKAIQLLNDAKRSYAMKYIYNNKSEYIGYPIIASSTYVSYGNTSNKDFVNITGEMTESDLASLQGYNGYTAIYKITGAQLKEWLEWSASAYTTLTSGLIKYSDGNMNAFVNKEKVNALVQDDWVDSWSGYYVFDGIDYTINPMTPPRYNKSGVKINTTNRISDLTYNGIPIKDDQVFVLATGKLAKTTDATKGIDKQAIYKGYVRTQGIIRDYIKEQCKLGYLSVLPDYNFSLDIPSKYKFILKTTNLAGDLSNRDWFVKDLGTVAGYTYTVASLSDTIPKETLNLLVISTNTNITSYKVKVAVEVTSKNKIDQLKYIKGDYDEKYAYWNVAPDVTNGSFEADQNDIYTVYVKDIYGNVTIKKVNIDNIYSDALAVPVVNSYTNRKTKISGKADPGKTIIVETPSGNKFKTKSTTAGTFSLAIPAQVSGDKVTVYAMDDKTSSLSEKVTVKVKRTGPNQPKVYGAFNNSDHIYGNLNDDDANVFAIVGTTVYVGNDATAELYKACTSLYKEEQTIVKTNVSVDNSLEYSLVVPVQKVGTTIKVYTLDHLSRASRVNSIKVVEVAPNPPVINELTCIDTKIYGTIDKTGSAVYSVHAIVGSDMYECKADKDGDFVISLDKPMEQGEMVSVYAQTTVNGRVKTSYITKVEVQSPESYVQDQNDLFIAEPERGMYSIEGWNNPEEPLTVAVYSNNKYKIYETSADANGDFTVWLDEPLKEGDIVYGYTRLEYGGIVDMVKAEVEITLPEKPVLNKEITNNTRTVNVTTDVESEVILTIGDKTYKSTDNTYLESKKAYRYTIKITKPVSETKYKITATNQVGTSKACTGVVSRVVPDAPKVNSVNTGSNKVTGVVHSVGVTNVFVKIGTHTYEGNLKTNGKFSISIPKQNKNTKITVYATNHIGSSVKSCIKVKKKA